MLAYSNALTHLKDQQWTHWKVQDEHMAFLT